MESRINYPADSFLTLFKTCIFPLLLICPINIHANLLQILLCGCSGLSHPLPDHPGLCFRLRHVLGRLHRVSSSSTPLRQGLQYILLLRKWHFYIVLRYESLCLNLNIICSRYSRYRNVSQLVSGYVWVLNIFSLCLFGVSFPTSQKHAEKIVYCKLARVFKRFTSVCNLWTHLCLSFVSVKLSS